MLCFNFVKEVINNSSIYIRKVLYNLKLKKIRVKIRYIIESYRPKTTFKWY